MMTRRRFLQSSTILVSGLARLKLDAADSSETGVTGSVERIDDRVCLFLDDRFVAEQAGLRRTWHQGQPLPDPAIVADPWDNWPHLFGSVLYDPQDAMYKMWYSSIREGIFYAQSRDARTWIKPKLGLLDFNGSRENNHVMTRMSLPNVLLDPNEKDPAARFKLFAWDHSYYDREPKEERADGHKLFRSHDGIHWEPVGPGVPGSLLAESDRCTNFICPDTNQVISDSPAGRYLASFRTYPKRWTDGGLEAGRRRSVGISTAAQITGPWQPIVTSLVPDEHDDKAVALAFGDKWPGAKWAELYVMPLFPYGKHYIGLLSLLHVVCDGAGKCVDNAIGAGDLQFAFSHDGVSWCRPAERRPLIARSGATDLHPVYAACSPPLEMGNEIWVFYAEANSSHPATEDPRSQIRAAAWRRDGFVSLDAAEKPGSLTTCPLKLAGSRLVVNAQTAAGGVFRVALLDETGQAIPGFGLADCDDLLGDHIAREVSWRQQSDISALIARPLRLKVELAQGSFYSFRSAS